MTKRNLGGHAKRIAAIGAFCVALAVVVVALLLPAAAGNTARATATPDASVIPTQPATPSPTATPSDTPTPSPTATIWPTPIPSGWDYSDLDGVPAPANLAHRLPMAIMVDDNTIARPQSGFSSASIVYQAMADGGETRYMMVFQEGTADDIGPVRSARPYYVYWATEYKALYGHFGGDAESLRQVIPSLSKYIYNEDDLNGGACPYHRITTRPAPHNAYTNSNILIACMLKRGYPATIQKVATRPFRDDTPWSQLPAEQTISIPYRTGTVGYQFDPTTDSYLRLIGGKPQIDPANDQQVYARNIIVMYQAYAMVPALDEMRPVVYNVGTGKATIFMEGQAISATWKKSSNTALTLFYDASGKEIPLVRGEIFIQSVPLNTTVSVG